MHRYTCEARLVMVIVRSCFFFCAIFGSHELRALSATGRRAWEHHGVRDFDTFKWYNTNDFCILHRSRDAGMNI